MNCPYCGAELVYNSFYYRGNYSSGEYEKLGDIYSCPNSEGFEDIELRNSYIEECNLVKSTDYEDVEEVICESSNCNGSFYTDNQDNLYEGYPC